MDNNGKPNREVFITTVCSICGLCKDPDPEFCTKLYDTDGSKFINEIILRVKLLRETNSKTFSALKSFEGFTALFCHPNRCPLYEEDCDSMLSTPIVCFQAFLKQAEDHYQLGQLRDIYAKWSGIELREVRKKFNTIENINKVPLSKKQSKRIRKSIKKAKKRLANQGKRKRSERGKTETLFFYNSNEEWKEKISKYLGKNEQSQDHNRQPDKAHKCTGQSDRVVSKAANLSKPGI